MGWREAPDHAESVLDAARRRLPRLLNHQNFSQHEREVRDLSSIGACLQACPILIQPPSLSNVDMHDMCQFAPVGKRTAIRQKYRQLAKLAPKRRPQRSWPKKCPADSLARTSVRSDAVLDTKGSDRAGGKI